MSDRKVFLPPSKLPRFEVGVDLVIEERWRGRLWSAVPHRVRRSSPSELITTVKAGTGRGGEQSWIAGHRSDDA